MRWSAILVPVSLVALIACGAGKESLAADGAVSTPDASEVNPDAVVATWDGGQVTRGELDEQVGSQLQAMQVEYLMKRHDTESQALQGLVRDRVLAAEADARGVSVEDLLRVEVEEKAEAPTEDEIAQFYAANRQRIGDATLEEASPFIAAQLTQGKQGERFRTWYQEVQTARSVTTALSYPDLPRIDVPISDTDASRGPVDAPVTIIEFAEYQCPYCGRAQATVDQILANYGDSVRLVFKDFPLGFHDHAHGAAVAARCAGEQGMYWDMNGLLLGNQQSLTADDINGYATQIGADMTAFQTCISSGKFDDAIAANMSEAQSVGVSATPTFFVNGIMVSGAQPFENFAPIIDREIGS